MKIIAFDIMNNEIGVKPAVLATLEFIKNNPNFKIILVGNQNEIEKYCPKNKQQLAIINAPKIANPNLGAMIFRDQNTSMYHAIKLVQTNQADVVLSAGSSSAYLAYTNIMLKRLNNVLKPAFLPIFPTIFAKKHFLMLDVGANLLVEGKILYQWAKMAIVFANMVLKISNPRVGIINIGVEVEKGQKFHHQAHKLLTNDKKINFQGFVEPNKLLQHQVDIAIVDGYAGNLILKTMEGVTTALKLALKTEIKKSKIAILGALLARKAFQRVKTNLDFRNFGGAWIIGLEKLAIKAHGSSDQKSFLGALKQIKRAIKIEYPQKLKEVTKAW